MPALRLGRNAFGILSRRAFWDSLYFHRGAGGLHRLGLLLQLAERAQRLAPQDPVVLSTWGFLQLARGKVNEAIAVFDRAIAQDSTRGEPHLGKGLALFRRGKTD